MRRASLCLLALMGVFSACSNGSGSSGDHPGSVFGTGMDPSTADGQGGDGNKSPDASTAAPDDGDGDGDSASAPDGGMHTAHPDASAPSAAGDASTPTEVPDAGEPPADAPDASADSPDASAPPPADPTIDPKDPPKPTPACGTDLDVHNGTVRPDFGSVPAGGEFTGNPLDKGPLKVVATDATLPNPDSTRQQLSATTYGPSTDGAKIDAGPFPLLVLLPGFSGQHTGYRHFTDHFVSYGVAVVGMTPANWGFLDAANNAANVAEVRSVLDWALTKSPLAGKIDATKIAIAGHSEGGKIAFYTAAEDHRFDLVIGWDPQNGGGPPCFIAPTVGADCNASPVAPNCQAKDPGKLVGLRAESIVFAARDTNITPDMHLWAENFYRGAPSPAHLVLFPSAGHADWGATGGTTDVTMRVQMALVLSRYFGKTGLDDDLPGGSYLAGLSTVQVFSK